MKIGRVLKINLTDDFTCHCGNHSGEEGLFPCDESGKLMEPVEGVWEGHCKCLRCDQVYQINLREMI
jgi:hypothetical protein